MKKAATILKSILLATVLAIVAWSALPGHAKAEVTCEATGHSCHALVDGHTYHLKLATDY